jgi:hypothetical protein
MDDQPRIVARAAQPYVAVTERVTLDQFPGAIDRGFAEVFGWLARMTACPRRLPR